MGSTDIAVWLKRNLPDVLPFLVSDDIIKTIMTFEDDRDLGKYMSTLTDISTFSYKNFLANYKKIRTARDSKDGERDDCSIKQKDSDKKNKKKGAPNTAVKEKNTTGNVSISVSQKEKEERQSGRKKKTKYTNLYSPAGKQKDVILLKGRHPCECQATRHQLINNCLKCGRIICQQEGSGPCLFCGTMIFSKEEQNIINSNSPQSRKLYKTIMDSIKSSELDKAVERRNKLLEFDRSFAQRTKVIDDEGEYFSSNSVWLSKEEREKLQQKEAEAHAKRHSSRLDKKFTLDFAGRSVIEEDPQDLEESFAEALSHLEFTLEERHQHPEIDITLQPVFQGSKQKTTAGRPQKSSSDLKSDKVLNYRVQDRELLEMSDNGVCLSLHQPWASLLVHGIKRYEGRTWYTSHRGRLWIAAASKPPTKEEIKDSETFFRTLRHDEVLTFPKSYPTGCLLGCVLITDCLPQEEYRSRYSDGECEDPFVFICEDPTPLDTLFPVTGGHRMYKLDGKIHQAANKVLLRMAKKLSS